MKASPRIKTPEQYLASLPEPRRTALTAIHKAILSAAPGLKPSIGSGMLGYGTYHHKYASGREGETAVIGLASQKNHISLYFGCATDDDGYLAEKNKDRLGNVSVGRSCVRFKKLEDLNLKVAMELVKEAARQAK